MTSSGMDHQKSKFSLIYGTLSIGGCWGLRPTYDFYLKTGWWNSNLQTSEVCKYLQTKSDLHISICQSKFKKKHFNVRHLGGLGCDNYSRETTIQGRKLLISTFLNFWMGYIKLTILLGGYEASNTRIQNQLDFINIFFFFKKINVLWELT